MRSHRATSGAFDVGRRRAACCRLGGHTPAHSWYEDPTGRVFAPFGLCSTPTEKWRGEAGECCPAGWLRAQRVLGRLKPACQTDCAVCCGRRPDDWDGAISIQRPGPAAQWTSGSVAAGGWGSVDAGRRTVVGRKEAGSSMRPRLKYKNPERECVCEIRRQGAGRCVGCW